MNCAILRAFCGIIPRFGQNGVDSNRPALYNIFVNYTTEVEFLKQRFDVTGMSCTACSSHVERAVSALAGVSSVNIDLMQNRMLVDYDSAKLSEAEICAAVTAAGYGARPAGAAGGSAALPPPCTHPSGVLS